MTDVGVLLPVRIETRFKNGDLWVRVVPDEPWFLRDDPRISADELGALRRFAAVPREPGPDGVPPAWRDLAGQVGAPRAVDLHRRFLVAGPGGDLTVREPSAGELRGVEPAVSKISGFPEELVVWFGRAGSLHEVLRLRVDRSRLLADFADPDVPGDRRWWEDWDEAVAVGMAGIIPASVVNPRDAFVPPIDALYVTGLGEGDPGEHFNALVAEGRVGLLEPGLPTNSVDGAAAAPLATDTATWWNLLQTPGGPADADVSAALTGAADRLGNMPGGDRPHRPIQSATVSVLWPALWGFAASQSFAVASGPAPARWAALALFPEGAYPIVRIGPQPYGLVPATATGAWTPADGDPPLEGRLLAALARLRALHAASARERGTAEGTTTDGLLDLIADTPTSGQFRYRLAWPLELWWVAMAASGFAKPWRTIVESWSARYPLAAELGLRSRRRYAAWGRSRRVGVPLVVPPGVEPSQLPALLDRLATAALAEPFLFAGTQPLEANVLDGHGDSLLLRLAVRSLQLLIADVQREIEGIPADDPERFARNDRDRGRLQQLIGATGPMNVTSPSDATQHLIDVTVALRALGAVPVPELERTLAATVDCSTHRIDAWLSGVPQRRLDTLRAAGARHRLGAYGWVDKPAPGRPGPTAAGLLHTPSASAALAAAVLRDRAMSDPSPRWDLDITSRTARVADRLAEHVRTGAHLAEALGREIERIVGSGLAVEGLRRDFPVRVEHAGRRVCDGLRILGLQPFPVTLTPVQEAAVQELRDGLDAYADLLVVDAVHHLVEGRPEVAGTVMDGAAGLSRPPELSLLRTAREGRAVSTSVVLALPYVADSALPVGDEARALLSPAATLDPSVAAFLGPADWSFELSMADEGPVRTLLLSDLGLGPVDALALTASRLERLAADEARPGAAVVGGDWAERYEQSAALVSLVGREPAGPRSLRERSSPADSSTDGIDVTLLRRYTATREVGAALARRLRAASDDPSLLRAAAAWGLAPDPGPEAADLAAAQLEQRLAAAPDPASASQAELRDGAAALVSPTGQVALTGTASELPPLDPAAGLDASWLTIVAAVRPRLAQLEAHQLTTTAPLTPWANRAGDPWQTDAADTRHLVAVYAAASLDVRGLAQVAVTVVDRFSEVVPAAEQHTGAAFGFDAPAARPQQAILLAVPPDVAVPFDDRTLAQAVADTRELAHARMARPVDLSEQFRALAPTGFMQVTGATATPLEVEP